MLRELKMSCIGCKYYSEKYRCQAVVKPCKFPAIKDNPVSLTFSDLSKLIDAGMDTDFHRIEAGLADLTYAEGI